MAEKSKVPTLAPGASKAEKALYQKRLAEYNAAVKAREELEKRKQTGPGVMDVINYNLDQNKPIPSRIPGIAPGTSLSDMVLYQKRLAELEAATKAREEAQRIGEARSAGILGALGYASEKTLEDTLRLKTLGTAFGQGLEEGGKTVATGISILKYSDGDPVKILAGIEQVAQGALTMGAGWNKAANSVLAFVPAGVRSKVATWLSDIARTGKRQPLPKNIVDDINNTIPNAKPGKPTKLPKDTSADLQKKADEIASGYIPKKTNVPIKSPDDVAQSIDDATARNNQFYGETLDETKYRLANEAYQVERAAENARLLKQADENPFDEYGNLKQPGSTGNYFDDVVNPQKVTPPVGAVDDAVKNTRWADEYENARAQGKSSAEARLISNTATGLRKGADDVNPTLSNAGRKLDDAPELKGKPKPDEPGKPGILDRLKPPLPKKPGKPDITFPVPQIVDSYVPPIILPPDGSGTPPSQERNVVKTPKKPKFFTPTPGTPGTDGTPGTPGAGGTPGTGGGVGGGGFIGGGFTDSQNAARLAAAGGTGGTGTGTPGFAAAAAAQAAASQAANAARARALSNQSRDKYATGVMRALSRAGDVFAGRSQARLGQQLTGVGRTFQQDVAANKQEGIVDQDTLTKAYIESLSSGYGGQAQDALRRYKSRAAEAQKISRIG